MIPAELEALVLSDSVGAIDPDERVELRARLDALTPEQRSEVAHLYDIASTVALTAPALEPPAHVRERLLAATREPVRYTVWAADAEWVDTGMPGIRSRILTVDKARSLVTLLIRAERGAVYPSHKHHGPEDCFILACAPPGAGLVGAVAETLAFHLHRHRTLRHIHLHRAGIAVVGKRHLSGARHRIR